MYNAAGFYNYRTDAWRARVGVSNPPLSFVWDNFELDLINNQNFVNWEDLALQDALLTNHSLSYSTGTENICVFKFKLFYTGRDHPKFWI